MSQAKKILKNWKPSRMWIDGKIYTIRQNKHKDDLEDVYFTEESVQYNITPNVDGNLYTSFRVPAIYYTRLRNHLKFNLQHLETETNTLIAIPKVGKDGELTITGKELTKIANARLQIHSILSEIRDTYRPIQFVSVPVLSEEIKGNFEKFKSEILSGEPIQGVHESIFQSSLKLHLTVVVFALMDKYEKAAATEALTDFKTTKLDPLLSATGSLKLKVSGINCMNDNHSKVDVLYAKAEIVDETENISLQKIVNELAEHFYEKGLIRKYENNVKLHVTLMNTKYRKLNPETPKKKKWAKRQPFDARPIMDKYKDFVFGLCNFDSIHLSNISTKGEDGFYEPISIIKLN